MKKITLENHSFDYTVRYSNRRKTIQLKLVSRDKLEIIAPVRCPSLPIEQLIRAKSNWILKQQARLTVAENQFAKPLSNDTQLPYLGQSYKLALFSVNTVKPAIQLNNDEITVCLPPQQHSNEEIKLTLKQWYIECATRILREKTKYWAKILNVYPLRICIREQKTRWGSCSTRKTISYNWRIVMAPSGIIDYLVIHELCHLKVPNHSRRFWELVAQYAPDYIERRRWLRDNALVLGQTLT